MLEYIIIYLINIIGTVFCTLFSNNVFLIYLLVRYVKLFTFLNKKLSMQILQYLYILVYTIICYYMYLAFSNIKVVIFDNILSLSLTVFALCSAHFAILNKISLSKLNLLWFIIVAFINSFIIRIDLFLKFINSYNEEVNEITKFLEDLTPGNIKGPFDLNHFFSDYSEQFFFLNYLNFWIITNIAYVFFYIYKNTTIYQKCSRLLITFICISIIFVLKYKQLYIYLIYYFLWFIIFLIKPQIYFFIVKLFFYKFKKIYMYIINKYNIYFNLIEVHLLFKRIVILMLIFFSKNFNFFKTFLFSLYFILNFVELLIFLNNNLLTYSISIEFIILISFLWCYNILEFMEYESKGDVNWYIRFVFFSNLLFLNIFLMFTLYILINYILIFNITDFCIYCIVFIYNAVILMYYKLNL